MNFRELSIKIPRDIRWDAAIQKSVHESIPYYVPEFLDIQFESEKILIICGITSTPNDKIIRDAISLIEKISSSFRDVKDQVLFSSPNKAQLSFQDPFKELVSNRSVVSTGRGKFVYANDFLAVFEALDDKITEYCISQEAVKELYPTTIETSSLLKSGYLKLSPQLAYFVAPAHLDNSCLIKLGERDILNSENREETLQNLGIPSQVMAPTVCYHCFEARKNTGVESGLITALNKCHRHEPVNVRSLERLTTYWMRELIAFGSSTDIQECLDHTLAWTTGLLDEWGCEYEVASASDPFFADMGSGNRLFQAAFSLKRELKMPVFGGHKVSIASFNHHQKTLVDKFDITASTSAAIQNLSSGCIGWGYERFIYSLFCHFGANLSFWPTHVKLSLNL